MTQNAILLTVDALGAGHIGYLGYERNTTPQLDEFVENSNMYPTCIAQSSHTRESMPSLFASAYPTQLGGVGSIPPTRPSLPQVLSDAGFATAGFHSNPYLSRAYGFDKGFENFDDSLPLARNRWMTFFHRILNHFKQQPYRRANSLNEQGLEWLQKKGPEQRFLWLHYMDPHGPYQPPPKYQQLFRDEVISTQRAKRLWRRTVDEPESITDEERRDLIDLYDAEIRYVDEMLGQFLNGLKEKEFLSNSVIIIAADHGDAFGKHGFYGHPRHLFEELVHVPLIVRTPGKERDSISKPVENIDIAPTILDGVDVTIPSKFEGRSLLKSSDTADGKSDQGESRLLENVAVAEARGENEEEGIVRTAIRTASSKLYVTGKGRKGEIHSTELYDLSTDRDEQQPINKPDERKRLLEYYRTHRKRVAAEPTQNSGNSEDVGPLVENRLQDLGYR